ncbi:MAG: Phosphoglycerate mutase, partial [uncultured Blastococcus sp.]
DHRHPAAPRPHDRQHRRRPRRLDPGGAAGRAGRRAGAGGGGAAGEGAARGRRQQPAGAVPADRGRRRRRPGRRGAGRRPPGRGALRGLDRTTDQGAGQGAALEGRPAAPLGRCLPRTGGGGARADPGPRGRRRPGLERHARPGRGLAGLQPRRRHQGDPGRRAGPAPRPVPADRRRPGLHLGGDLHRDAPVRRPHQRHRRRRLGADPAAAPETAQQGLLGRCGGWGRRNTGL